MKSENNTIFKNYMQIAVDIAKKASAEEEIPVGCIIVDDKNGKIITKSHNETIKNHNPTKHAEIICINKALKKLNTDRLTNCSMYITLEPCLMCYGAILLAKIGKVYIGCLSKKTGAIVSNPDILNKETCNHTPEIYYPIMEQECKTIIENFFKNKR